MISQTYPKKLKKHIMFPMRFLFIIFLNTSCAWKNEALQNISFVHVFFPKKRWRFMSFPVRDLPDFLPKISHTPGGFRLYRLDADGRISPWKHRGLVVPKFGGSQPLVTLNLNLPSRGTITYHHISQPGKLGEQSSTQKWDTGDILSIPLSHPNYQLRYWYRHFLTYRPIVFGAWDICLAYPPRHSQIIPSILGFPSLIITRGIQPCC